MSPFELDPSDAAPPSDDVPPVTLSRTQRGLLSLVLSLHVFAVFLAPFTFASSPNPGMAPPSPAAAAAMGVFHPYIEALFLQHGYAFFAPDPGPSHLFRVRLEYDDGRPAEELVFPDRQRQWPRLLYHRHFMLSERLIVGYVPPVAPPQVVEDPRQLVAWRGSHEAYETYFHTLRTAYLEHLKARHGAARATLVRVEHRLLDVDEVLQEGHRLNEPDFYAPHPDDVPVEELP